jgi:CubicO group peptidase (beta-lactamase class C family)
MKTMARAFVLIALVNVAAYVPIAQQTVAPRQPAAAAPQAAGSAESVGMSTERLRRLHDGMQGFVARREAGGIVTLIAREGKVVDVHASGFQDVESKTAMKTDTVFRIASMTKPVTSVAVMMLYEEGKLQLTDPVSRFIPAFKSQQVMDASGALTPARRPVTIRDLLTHRSGLTYGFLNNGPVGDAYRKTGVADGLTVMPLTLQEAIDKLASAPLMSQPGAAWNYSLSTDVLGRVVEVASGKPFDVFLKERVFTPLGMTDTSFEVPDARWSRLATVYSPDGSGGIRPMKDPESFGNTVMSPVASYKPPKKYFSGGAGLTSTARDYGRFAQMLLNGGGLDNARLLSPKSIELMTANHTSDIPGGGPLLGPGTAFGLGFQITTDLGATQAVGSNGMYGWSGIYGTIFWVDPQERLVAVMMVQRYPGSPVANAFRPLVYQALTKSLSTTTQ